MYRQRLFMEVSQKLTEGFNSAEPGRFPEEIELLLNLSVSMRAVIGQFCGPYSSVWPATLVSFPLPCA